MNTKEVLIKDIKVEGNIRTFTTDVGDLMQSVKKNGLLHPIGVYPKNGEYTLIYGARRLEACKKLGWKNISALVFPKKLSKSEFISLNTIENVQRENITPTELGKTCKHFRNQGYSVSEIASKLSISNALVQASLNIYRRLPKGYEHMIGFVKAGENKKGKIPPAVVNRILALRISKSEVKKILDLTRKEELSSAKIGLLGRFIASGATVEQAFKMVSRFAVRNVNFIVDKDEAGKIKGSFFRYANKMLKKINPALVYIEEDDN